MVDLVATPRTWKGVLFLVLVGFAAVFFVAATSLLVWAVVVGVVALVLWLVWLAIRGANRRGAGWFGGGR